MRKSLMLSMGALALVTALYATSIASGTTAHNTYSAAAFLWSETVYDFGKIPVNVPVSHEFSFTNNGESELLITSVKASCGCTVTDYTKDPIPPGGKGYVKATYNAARAGVFSKTVTVNANTDEGTVHLMIKGEVTE